MTKFRIAVIMLLISAVLIYSPAKAEAAKKFVRKTAARSAVAYGSIPVQVRYRPDHLGLLFSFSNFSGIASVSYSFTYNTNGNPQGAGGTVTAANNPGMQRELLFGTCSTSVCTYHYNLTNARLVFTAKMTNGTTVSKSYRIKTYL